MKKYKKMILPHLLLLAFSLNLLCAEEAQETRKEVELLPEVKALITKQETLPDDFFENNLFIGLAGVFYPEDNFYEVATEVFRHNYPEYLKVIDNSKLTTKDLDLVKLEDKLPKGKALLQWTREIRQLYELELCSNYLLENCITKSVEAKEKLQKLLSDNQELLQHYRDLALNYPKHKDQLTLMGNTSVALAEHHAILKSYQGFSPFILLTLNQAIFQLLNKEYDEGLENIRSAQSIVFTIFNDDETSLTAILIGTAYLQLVDQFIDALLSEGVLNNHLNDERVTALVAPYPQSFENTVYHSFAVDQDYLIHSAIGKEESSLDNEEINALYQLRNRYLDAVNQGTLTNVQAELQKECTRFKHYCVLFGPSDNFLKRYFTQRNYHNMVYLKYLILRDKITDNNIPAFLEAQGDIAIDPITQQRFIWDEKTRAITLPLAEAKYLPSFVRSAIMKDRRIKALQAMMPSHEG